MFCSKFLVAVDNSSQVVTTSCARVTHSWRTFSTKSCVERPRSSLRDLSYWCSPAGQANSRIGQYRLTCCNPFSRRSSRKWPSSEVTLNRVIALSRLPQARGTKQKILPPLIPFFNVNSNSASLIASVSPKLNQHRNPADHQRMVLDCWNFSNAKSKVGMIDTWTSQLPVSKSDSAESRPGRFQQDLTANHTEESESPEFNGTYRNSKRT